MEGEQGRGEIPSYKNMTAGESSGSGMQRNLKENRKYALVLGNRWQTKTGGRCLPKAQKKPRYVIPNNKFED